MKGIFLSNTPLEASQHSPCHAIPIGEHLCPKLPVVACVHAPRKWVARGHAIRLARTRSLFLAQTLSGRRHAFFLLANSPKYPFLGSRVRGASARVFSGSGRLERKTSCFWRASYSPKIQRSGSSPTDSTAASFDDRGPRWSASRNHFAHRDPARCRCATDAPSFADWTDFPRRIVR